MEEIKTNLEAVKSLMESAKTMREMGMTQLAARTELRAIGIATPETYRTLWPEWEASDRAVNRLELGH